MFYNSFLPGGIGGDGYKVYWLNKNYRTKISSLISASLLDRASGLIALLLLCTIFSIFISYEFTFKYLILLVIPIMYLLYYMIVKYFFTSFSAAFYYTNLYSIAVQVLQIISIAFILLAIGIQKSMIDYWFLFLVSSIAYALPITFGGVGSRELVFLFGAKILNLDVNMAVTVGLTFFLIQTITAFWGIKYLIFPIKLTYSV
jgi:uncharacterized membrane protein YbhN (UPF0104 family)